MFLAYWPVLALVVTLVLVAIFASLALAGRVCRARHETLPEGALESYLPESEDVYEEGVNIDPTIMNELPDIQMQLQGGVGPGGEDPLHGQFEPGISYHLDQSMSPEGRKEFGV
jgi:hypothetical protein